MKSKKQFGLYDENTLVGELQEGNKGAFNFLFESYYKLLCLYASSLLKNRDLANDIVQNVFLNIWLKRQQIAITTSIKSYLYQSVRNGIATEYKRKKREGNLLDQIHSEELREAIKEEEFIVEKKLQWVNKEIQLLPSKSREVFLMSKKRGLTYKEIANMLNISENTVESHISRALKRIQKNIPDLS